MPAEFEVSNCRDVRRRQKERELCDGFFGALPAEANMEGVGGVEERDRFIVSTSDPVSIKESEDSDEGNWNMVFLHCSADQRNIQQSSLRPPHVLIQLLCLSQMPMRHRPVNILTS